MSLIMMNIADTFFMVGIAITTSAVGEIHLGEGIKQYRDAVAACRVNNSRLVLPLSDAHNQWIKEYMNDQPQPMSSWIDLQIYPYGWQVLSTGVTLYNQGCYNNSSFGMVHRGNYSSINACMDFCSRKATKYAAYQRRDSTGHCICPQNVSVSAALAESSCTTQCPGIEGISCGDKLHMSYRVLTIDGATDILPWYTPGSTPQYNVQCAAYYWQASDTNVVHYLSAKYCSESLPSLCLNSNGIVTIETKLNWFSAHKNCHDAGGHLFSPSSNLSQIPTWRENIYHWTGVTSWGWTSDSHTDDDIFYTKWAGLSDITLETCVLMNPSGTWESTSCGTSRRYICESGNFSVPERTTTAAATTSTSNADTGSTVTALYSQDTDIDTDTTAYTEYTLNGQDTDNDTDTTAYTEYSTLFPEPSTNPSLPDSESDDDDESQNSVIGIPIGVSLVLVAIIITIVGAILIYRRLKQKKNNGLPVMKNHPPSNQTCDNIIRRTSVTAFGRYELTDINGEGASPSYPRDGVTNVAPDQDGEAGTDEDEEPPVYGTPDKGRTDEGVLIVDNELYGDC